MKKAQKNPIRDMLAKNKMIIAAAVAVSVFAGLSVITMGDTIGEGDVVSVHYTGKLDDGTVFDSSEGREPLTFTAGTGQVIEGFDKAVVGKKEGDELSVSVPADEAYGQPSDELIREFGKDDFGENLPGEGDTVMFTAQSGQNVPGRVVEVGDSSVTVDLNHPLAGENLNFEITIVSVQSK